MSTTSDRRRPGRGGGDTPPGPKGVAHLRLLRTIFKDPQPVLTTMSAEFGPVCALGAGPARIAIVGDPGMVRELLAMPTDHFRWGHKFNVLGFVVGPTSLIVSDGEPHRRRRAAVQPAFSRRRLNGWVPMILQRTDATIDALASGADHPTHTSDLKPPLRLLVMSIAVHAFFGEQLARRVDEIGRLFERPQAYLESPAIRQFPHPFPRTTRARVRADRLALDAIIDEEIVARRHTPSEDPLDVLSSLVTDGSLSDAEIRDQVVTLIGAGYDTTAAALAWAVTRATLKNGLWGRLRAEADDVLGSADTADFDHTVLPRLELATRVMKETLRLHPPGVIAPREAAVDITLGRHVIRKGTLILWSPYLLGRDSDVWENPTDFDPDRFLDPTPAQQLDMDRAWLPFGGGARMCIGFALAQMELTLILARLAQRLDLERVSKDVPTPIGMVVNRPAGPAAYTVTPRIRT
jgi:cytochrome P450